MWRMLRIYILYALRVHGAINMMIENNERDYSTHLESLESGLTAGKDVFVHEKVVLALIGSR
jgi:hypothetical protein